MKSAKLINGKVEIIDISKPILNTSGAIIKVLGCGLCGSDLVKIKHATKENEDKIILGHEVVGVIEQLNCKVKNHREGDIVALGHHYPCLDKVNCRYCKNESYSMCPTFKTSNIFPSGFSEYIKISEKHLRYTTYRMNPNLAHDEKAFLEPLSCCLRAIHRAGYKYDNKENKLDSALVVGLGSIGLLMLKGLRAYGVKAYGFDISQQRMINAAQHGFCYEGDKKYDTVFLTAGNSKALDTALKSVIDGGKIIVFSSIENDSFGFSNNEIYYRELSIISSYSPSVDDIKLSAELLNNKIVNVAGLSSRYALDNLAQAVDDSFKGNVFKAYIEI
ncbi:alcohol dehydrogenase catalytic domain-containing protein [bacterium]|nr:alcohol dehydrogenase catalytic domain-containing protein [bacterium]